jgi:hypothetical protein
MNGIGSQALMTVGDVANLLHVSGAWVRDHATRKQPRLPVVKVGKLRFQTSCGPLSRRWTPTSAVASRRQRARRPAVFSERFVGVLWG